MFWCCNTEKSTVECVIPVNTTSVIKPDVKPDNKLVINEVVLTESNPINYDIVISDTRPRLNPGFNHILLESAYSK